MSTFRKRPIEVDAVRLDTKPPEQEEAVLTFVREHGFPFRIDTGGFTVWTVDGNEVLVPWGAYLVIDAKGYPYPCDAEIFEAGHVPADELRTAGYFPYDGILEVYGHDVADWRWRLRNRQNGQIVAGPQEGYTDRDHAWSMGEAITGLKAVLVDE